MEILVEIQSQQVIRGKFPKAKQKLVLEWAKQHQHELIQNWELARRHQPLLKIQDY